LAHWGNLIDFADGVRIMWMVGFPTNDQRRDGSFTATLSGDRGALADGGGLWHVLWPDGHQCGRRGAVCSTVKASSAPPWERLPL
jgi:hypothetical protein